VCPVLIVAIWSAVEVPVVEVAASAHRTAAVAALSVPAALWRRRLAVRLESQRLYSSVHWSAFILFGACTIAARRSACATYIPVLPPLRQIWMVHPPIATDMLPRAHKHVLRRLYVYYRRLPGVGVRYPYVDGEAIGRVAKGHRHGPADEEQKRRSSIFIS
jgi:hypothetical protein